jgi:SAM-dependent methyltransferase
VVILGGNIMINIQTVMCYEQAQYKFIKKAADALKIGGHLYLDCDLYAHPENIFVSNQESIIFEGKDAYGTLGRCISCWEKYDSDTQIASGVNKIELTDLNGNKISFERYYEEHIPTIINLRKWISEAGLKIVYEYGNYNRDTINEQTTKAIIWAVKE